MEMVTGKPEAKKPAIKFDPEIKAMGEIHKKLGVFNHATRDRMLTWLFTTAYAIDKVKPKQPK